MRRGLKVLLAVTMRILSAITKKVLRAVSLRGLSGVGLKDLSAAIFKALPASGLKVVPAVAAFALLLVAPEAARACSCLMSSARPCARAWSAPVVFAGLVTGAADAPKDAGVWLRRAYRFEVEESFHGGRAGTVEVLTGQGGGDCGYGFVVGQRYLVYAGTNAEGRLTASICSATRPVEQAAADLEFLRALPRLPAESSVYGSVEFSARDLVKGEGTTKPVREARVLVEGGGTRREVSTDAGGKFQLAGLPPGAYTARIVEPGLPGDLRQARSFELRERQCADLHFTLTWEGGVSGKVIGESGELVHGARVTLAPPGLRPEEFESYEKTLTGYTDEDGHYSFEHVPPGRYVVIVNAHGRPRTDQAPYPRTFLPGVEDRQLASVIEVGDGSKLTDQNIRLPRRLVARELTGMVVWPDGRAAGQNTSVQLFTAARPWHDISSASVGEQGSFTLKGWDGGTYVVTATANLSGGKQVCAGPVEVTLGERAETVRLVLTTPYGNCLAGRSK